MRRYVISLLLTFSLFIALVPRAFAQGPICLPPDQMAAALLRAFGEQPLATALTPQHMLIDLYVGATGSWTMTITQPDGSACIIATGSDFNLLHRDGLIPATAT